MRTDMLPMFLREGRWYSRHRKLLGYVRFLLECSDGVVSNLLCQGIKRASFIMASSSP